MAGHYQGYFTDGLTAARHSVRITTGSEALRIEREDKTLLAEWTYAGLKVLEEVHGTQAETRLRHKRGGEGVLTVSDALFLQELRQVAGQQFVSHWIFRPTLLGAGLSLVGIVVVVLGLYTLLPLMVTPLASWVPEEWETALGEQVISNMTAEHPRCTSPAGEAALTSLVDRISPPATRTLPLRVQVSSRPDVNAFAAPGGEIVVLRGLIDKAENPEEVAGVLAHEMAHALERHPLKGALRALGLQLLLNALGGDMSVVEETAGKIGALMLVLKYGREAEQEADLIAIDLLNQANIRGDGLASFFARLQNESPALPVMFSTHPLTGERLAEISGRATGTQPALSPQAWQALRTICD